MTFGFWARLVPALLVGFLLQAVLFDQVEVLGVHPDMMVVLAAAAGVVFGPARGAVIAFFLGLLADLLVVLPFGLSSLSFCLLAFGVGQLPSLGSGDGRRSVELAVCVVGAAAGTVLYAVLGALVGQRGMLGPATPDAIIVVTVGAVVLGAPALAALGWVASGLATPPVTFVPPGGSALGGSSGVG
jgi:rod shape-determining protein MreD